jgi:type I restriction enzyme, S subunit
MIERKELYKVISKRIPGEWGDAEGNVKVLRTANFTNDGKINFSNVVSRKIDNKNLEKKKLIPGDIIIEKSGGGPKQPVGRVVFFDREDDSFLCNNFTAILRCNQSTFSKYLFYYLFSLHKMGVTLKFQNKTTGIINLKLDKYLEKIQIPLPPLPEQKRIATILDKADALRQKNKQLLAAYDKLLQSVFLDMFGDPVTNPKRWEKIPFSKCGRFISGGTPSKKNKSYWNGNFPWVSPKDMKTPIIYDSEDHISEGVFKETSLKKIAKNNVLIVVRGMILTHSFPVAINNVEIAINQDMKAIELKNNINNVYLLYCLKLLRRQIIDLISSAGHGTKKFDSVAFERLFIPIPDGKIQNQFAQIVENIESQKALVKQSIQESEDLFNGLVQKAFKGELV